MRKAPDRRKRLADFFTKICLDIVSFSGYDSFRDRQGMKRDATHA